MKQTYTLFLLFVLLFTACSEPDDYSPVLRGTISGKVLVYNEYNEPESAQGAVVTITGDRINLTATADAAGNYKIDNVPHTKLVILVQKQGFKGGQRIELDFFTEQEEVDLRMSRVPTITVSQAAFYWHNADALRATITLSAPVPSSKDYKLATFLGKTADVSDTNYLVKSINGFTSDGQATKHLLPSIFVEDLVNRYGFKSGDTAYIKVYTGAAMIYGYWLGDIYFEGPGLNTTNAQTFTVTIP
ncbi:carboxypeptidase-like regulatory domain-containing protein [Pontibacter sp. H259]|uniref:carboxypeptidase-like regulatory domain-containing protein n=1 Tax=Pontibacter sp. H259 TaxID=3133421 RepID=UPI0030C1476B